MTHFIQVIKTNITSLNFEYSYRSILCFFKYHFNSDNIIFIKKFSFGILEPI